MKRLGLALVVVLWMAPSCGGAGGSLSPTPSTSPAPPPSEVIFNLNLFEAPDVSKIRQMASRADAVVVGTVRDISTRWERAEFNRPLIYSYVQVEVEDSLKGTAHGVITIRNVGGRVGDRMLRVSHVPEFKHVGEKGLFFLRQDGGRYKITFDQPGKILIHQDDRQNDVLAFLDQEIPLTTVRDTVLEAAR